ncbi:metallophosphoesterase [Vibrio breoganii]
MPEQLHIGIMSDLHLEEIIYWKNNKPRIFRQNPEKYLPLLELPTPTQKLDYLLLAGDICEIKHIDLWIDALDHLSQHAQHLYICDGNHETWGTTYQNLEGFKHTIEARYSNITVLLGESASTNDLEIFGGCLWSDFGDNVYVMDEITERYSNILTCYDFFKIKYIGARGRKFNPAIAHKINCQQRNAIKAWLKDTKGTNKKRILMTHFPATDDLISADNPHTKDLPKEFLTCFHGNLMDVLEGHEDVTLVHGHLHGSSSYTSKQGNTVLTNPRGTFNPDTKERTNYNILERSL